ncbi:MAG: diphthine--ammonia ligase [Candidatus Jordarchaeales archaeon]|nr:diphthine--ammonia ligase [Candidatus Jordarchaeia archaeon]
MSYVASWSGGKDSCLACYEAMCSGLRISHLINFVYEGRVRSHGVSVNLVRLQAELVGIPLVQVETTWEDYEENFKKSVRSLIPQGVRGIVFGDLYLDEHRKWVERVCGELGVEAVEPLWGLKPREVISRLLDAGFEAVIVSARSNLIGEEWAGCRLSWEFIEYLEDRGIDLCGENGEYHTLVVNGPIFRRRLEINFEGVVRVDGRWVAMLSPAGGDLAERLALR